MTLAVFRRRAAFAAAWAALVWERAAAVLWPALAFPSAFVVLALLGVWERTGDPWRGATLAVSVLLTLAFALRGALAGPWPKARDARRRVEIDSELKGRPFEALDDSPVAADPTARALWRAHQARMREALTHVRARRPRAALAARDIPAIRGVLTLAAVGGLVVAGAAAPGRLLDAFAPSWLAGGATRLDIQAWIAPPDYTRRAPVFLRGDRGSFEAPAGSELIVRVVGAHRAPALRLDDGRGRPQRVAFEEDGPAAHAATSKLDGDTRVMIAGKEWTVRVVPDTAPGAAFAEEPEAGTNQELTFTYLLEDDYGVVEAHLRIQLTDEPDTPPLTESLDAPPGAKSVEEVAHLDLTEHPWAGREAELTIVARDANSQIGESASVVMKLPERIFVDPLARAILEQRTTLFSQAEPYAPAPERPPLTAEDAAAQPPIQTDQTSERIGRAPEAVKLAHRSLELMRRGAAMFEDDGAVHLALGYVADRLAMAREREEIEDLRDVLWDTALRAEGGDLADAERALRQAERALARALARGDSPEEIERLMEEYREAVNRYMELLTLEAMREGRVLSEFSGGGMGGMGEDQLQAMLDALQDLAETGSNEDARRALAALSEMLRNMQVQLAMGGGGQGQPQQNSPMSQAMRDALEELAEVLGLQRQTMDQTQLAEQGRRGQQGESGQNGEGQQPGEPGAAPGQSPAQGETGAPMGSGEQPGQQSGAAPGQQRNGLGAPGEGDAEFGPGFGQLLDRQREIREALNQLLEDLGAGELGGTNDGAAGEALDRAEEGMRRAERAMGLAEDALEDEDGQGALLRQGQALESLREGLEALAQGAQAAERAAAGLEEENRGERATRDPFGRNAGGSGFDVGNDVKVPDEMERRRAREILDELRRRSGEADRPQDELDYLRRLLDRF